jgi:hypothetical protein
MGEKDLPQALINQAEFTVLIESADRSVRAR